MRTGFEGTFVVSWSQTEADGVAAPLPVSITVGTAWRWHGQAVRVDAPGSVLVLERPEGGADLRRRAARMVRKLVGEALAPAGAGADPVAEAEPKVEQGFTLTDGRALWYATIIPVRDTATRLVMFAGQLPPAGMDLWVVECTIDRADRLAGAASGGFICFTPGTLLATPEGPRPIEALRPGDRINTADNGPQPIMWTGSRHLSGARLFAQPHLRPIRIRRAALGDRRPDRDLLVSPQHRMLVRGAAAMALFNTPEVLVAATDLVDHETVFPDSSLRAVTYIHLLLEAHQVIVANGLETESFHPSNAALDALDPMDRAGLVGIVPGVDEDAAAYGPHARRNVSAAEAAILRHEAA